MDVLGRILTGGDLWATWGPLDDRWYQQNPGVVTEAGIRVDADQAKKISAWYRGRDILATVLAMLPLQVMERLPNGGGANPAKGEPLYGVLHDKPNSWQDSFRWRRQQMYHLIDYGNGINKIVAGGAARGFVGELHPVDPRLVTATQLESKRIVYTIKNPKTNQPTTATQDEIFHLCGASDDGFWGKGILEYARQSLGTASATESYAANIFSRGTLHGGVIENPGVLNEGAARRMALSFATKMGEWHLPKILEQGSKFVPNDMTPEDAQMLLSRKYTVDDIARWLGVPRLMLENSDPSFGNAEQFTQNFIDFFMGPWLSLWEYAIRDQLIIDPDRFFAQFTRQALVRGNFKDRVDGLTSMVNAGIITVDEARDVEDLNKRGGAADELREPQNITGKPAVPSSDTQDDPAADPAEPAQGARAARAELRAHAIAHASAERLLRKEVAAVQKAAVRHAADEDAFVAAVTAFYEAHVALVVATLSMSEAEARTYCAGQAHQIVNGEWLRALDLWQTSAYAGGLAAIALEEAA
jgi:HK97 family phage portal protein